MKGQAKHVGERPNAIAPSMVSRAGPRMSALGMRVASALELLAIAVWLGGLVALGAIAAPVVFSVVSLPTSADAMTVVFRRFDLVAMSCAALALAVEGVRALARFRPAPGGRPAATGDAPSGSLERVDRFRAAATALAAAAAVFEGMIVSPRIAALHASGVIRGSAGAGMELLRLHDLAEWCGKSEVVLLAAVLVLQAPTFSNPARDRAGSRG